jgi:Na+/melibiose symporter-like transporter
MVNNRNGFTYIANISVLSLSLILFLLIPTSTTCFTILCITCLTGGLVTTIFYSYQIRETKLSSAAKELEDLYRQSLTMTEIQPARLNNTDVIDYNTNMENRTHGTESERMSEVCSQPNEEGDDDLMPKKEAPKKTGRAWYDWLKEAQFYIFGFVYMFARMALNSTATMMPLYLTICTGFEEVPGEGIPPQIALVPLCSYTSSLIFTQYIQAPMT